MKLRQVTNQKMYGMQKVKPEQKMRIMVKMHVIQKMQKLQVTQKIRVMKKQAQKTWMLGWKMKMRTVMLGECQRWRRYHHGVGSGADRYVLAQAPLR